jgi:cytochrome c biogenesis protein CcdA/thiol-disulfide isomerase/thioredoxin
MLVLLFFAALSGLVTVFSPCILPVLPIVLSSTLSGGKRRPIGVIVGLIVSFSLFTLAITQIVTLLGLSANTLRLAAVAILGILGLSLIVPALSLRIEQALSRLPGLARQSQGSGFGSGLLTGASLGLVWAPCAGPILAAVTTLAATMRLSWGAAAVVGAYALGAGIPLLAIAYGGRAVIQRVPLFIRNMGRLQQVFGAVMVLTAVLIAFNADTLVTAWATNLLPSNWSAQISSFENSPLVSQQLNQLTQPTGTPAPLSGSLNSSRGASMDASNLPDLGVAPEITDIDHWINSSPLTLQELRGKVVLVDFWTYSCINCIHTLPYVTAWYGKYKDDGFVVIGVHTPEFAFEHDTSNVEQAVQRFNIAYPVAQDNNYRTWQAFQNKYWPAEYLIDAEGHIRHEQFGEGNYKETEQAIQELLAAAGHPVKVPLNSQAPVADSAMQSPETYIGVDRQSNFASPQAVMDSVDTIYSFPKNLPLNDFAVAGNWDFQAQYAQAAAAGTQLELHFAARDVYLVMSSEQPVKVRVDLLSPGQANSTEDIDPNNQITVQAARLYHIVHLDQPGEGQVVLQFDQPGAKVISFTFGG